MPLLPLLQLAEAVRGDGVDGPSRRIALELLQRAERPQPLGEIAGAWQVRSVQLHSSDAPSGFGFVHAYPYFRASIERTAECGYHFAKTSGSQRRSGGLYAMSDMPDALAFLGMQTVNEDPALAYRGDSEHASAGRLIRIGTDELLMILDATPERFELYQLRRP